MQGDVLLPPPFTGVLPNESGMGSCRSCTNQLTPTRVLFVFITFRKTIAALKYAQSWNRETSLCRSFHRCAPRSCTPRKRSGAWESSSESGRGALGFPRNLCRLTHMRGEGVGQEVIRALSVTRAEGVAVRRRKHILTGGY